MRLKKNTAGLTLIEVIISLAVLGIIIIAILNTLSFGYDTIFSMGRKTKAMQIAQGYIDMCYNTNQFTTSIFTTNIISITPETGYSIDAANTNAAYDSQTKLYNVKVTILYRQNRSVSLTALVPGLAPMP